MIHQIYNLRKYELDLNTKKVPLASLEGKDERGEEGGVRRCCRRPQNEQICLPQNAAFHETVPKAANLIFCRSRRFIENVCRSKEARIKTVSLMSLKNSRLLSLKLFK